MVQGGQNLLSVYAKVEDETIKPDWGPTSALAYAIASPAESGGGDEQMVVCTHLYDYSIFEVNSNLDYITWPLCTILWKTRR